MIKSVLIDVTAIISHIDKVAINTSRAHNKK